MRWEWSRKEKKIWKSWFAWYPVRLRGTNTYVWLEWVVRKIMWSGPLGNGYHYELEVG